MILNEHYKEEDAVLNPKEFHTELQNFPKTAVAFFSKKLLKLFLKKHESTQIVALENETTVFPVFKTKVKNRNLAVYQSPVGAPASASLLEDMIAFGAQNIIAVGCCGCLESHLKDSDIIIPTSAIRDEGLSYQYLKTNDEIELNKNMTDLLQKSLDKQKVSYVTGKTWTTDGIYRETSTKVEKRKKQGAIVVEMEVSALASVAEFRKVNFAQILYGADSLAGGEYDKRAFRGDKISKKTEGIVEIALNCAAFVDAETRKQKKEETNRPQIKKQSLFRMIKTHIDKRIEQIRRRHETE